MAEDSAFAALTTERVADTQLTATENAGFLQETAPPPPPPMPVAETPPPPPAMPDPTPPPAAGPPPIDPDDPDAPPPATGEPMATTTAAPAEKPAEKTTGGWEVDSWRLRSFGDAVVRARSYLDAVQMKVDRMQGAELTPQLGTSPVGEQLAKKFDDRLNSVEGLRAMLTEAMKRMEDFVTSAEKAAKAYEEADEAAEETFENYEFEDDPVDKPVKS
jgi:hypothetical protein